MKTFCLTLALALAAALPCSAANWPQFRGPESLGIGEGAENAHTNWAHFYVQDGWQVTPGLKIDVGLRYEYNSNLVAETNQALERLRNLG